MFAVTYEYKKERLSMTIETMRLKNFRRFSELSLRFSSRMNVFVGVNGAGKSTILSAIAKMLTWYIRRLLSPQGGGTGQSISEREIKNKATESSISVSVDVNDRKVAWTLVKSRRSAELGTIKSDLKSLNEHIRDVRQSDGLRSVPVLVGYTVNRAVLDVPLRIRKHHEFSVMSVYDRAFDGSADFRTFFEWFREHDDIDNERLADILIGESGQTQMDSELTVVKKALSVFLPQFCKWRIRRSPLRMEVVKDGEVFNIEQLSDGEKSLIAMIGDLARRLSIANPGVREPLHGRGIVLIDEVELHLHPAWQRDILPRLMNTFPNVQFMVTTHSPLVLAQLNSALYRQHCKQSVNEKKIEVFAVKDGTVASMLDDETGLLVSGEMDDVANEIDAEFERMMEGGCK